MATRERNTVVEREHLYGVERSLISWKSIFAGLFVALIAYVTLMALGAGIGGASASEIIEEGGKGGGLATGAAVWMGISILFSFFAGGYFAARTSNFLTGRIGAAQGVMIAALFFAFMFYGVGKSVGAIGKGMGQMIGAVGSGATDVASSPVVQDTVQKALGNAQLKSEPNEVAQGLATRMLRGDREGAANYLAYQTGQSRAEVDARMATFEAEFQEAARNAGVQAADAVSSAGWALFITLLIGIGSAIGGGVLGSHRNAREPLVAAYELRHAAVAH